MLLVGLAFFVSGAFAGVPDVARWIGFALAAYSTVANDSIQTVGTFIVVQREAAVVGAVAVHRRRFPRDGHLRMGVGRGRRVVRAPRVQGVRRGARRRSRFSQVAAPVFLLILTRLRMPVSTTFLILSCFATDPGGVAEVLEKSLYGYGTAFIIGAVAFGATARWVARAARGPASRWWGPAQWLSTGMLWTSWIQQDMANLAVYLPRDLGPLAFAAFAGTVFLGLGVLFYLRGDRIQRIVSEKSSVVDIRAATLIDFVYAFILFGFKEVSNIPMSTTWVFIGLLAGRELAITLLTRSDRSFREGLRLAGRDVLYATIGLVVSLGLAVAANPVMREAVFGP